MYFQEFLYHYDHIQSWSDVIIINNFYTSINDNELRTEIIVYSMKYEVHVYYKINEISEYNICYVVLYSNTIN